MHERQNSQVDNVLRMHSHLIETTISCMLARGTASIIRYEALAIILKQPLMRTLRRCDF